MAPSNPEVLAERLYERLSEPKNGTPEALTALLSEIESAQEKPVILSLVRERLSKLNAQEQQQIDANLQELQSRLGTAERGASVLTEVVRLRKELSELSADVKPAATALEWAQREFEDISKDFMEGSLLKKAGYVTGVYIGYRVVTGLWKKIRSVFTSSEKKGFFGKLFGGIAAVGGAVAGAIGVSQLLKSFGMSSGTENPALVQTEKGPDGKTRLRGFFDRDKDNPIVPDAVEDVVEPAAEGTYRGYEDLKNFFGPAFDALWQHENVRTVMQNKDQYDSDFDYVQAVVKAALADGLHFTFDGTTAFLFSGGKLISLEGEFLAILFGGLTEGEMDMGDLLSVYIEGFVLYATSFTALKLLTLKRFGANSSALLEAGLWPYYVVKRTFGAARGAVKFTHELTYAQSATRLGLRRRAGSFTQTKLQLGRYLETSADGLAARHAHVIEQMKLLQDARSAKGIDAQLLRAFEVQESASVSQFLKYAKTLAKKGGLPDWFLSAQELSGAKGIAPDLLTADHIRDILRRVDPKNIIPGRPARVSSPRVPVQQPLTEAQPPPARQPTAPHSEPPSPARTATEADEALRVAEETPSSTVPHSPLPETPPRRMAVGDGVVPEAQPGVQTIPRETTWTPRIVRPDGSVVDPATGQIIEGIPEAPSESVPPTRAPSEPIAPAEPAPETPVRPGETPVDEAARAASEADELLRQAEQAAKEWEQGILAIKRTVVAPNATPEVLQAFDTAASRCKEMGMTLEQTGKMLKDVPTFAVLSGKAKSVTAEQMKLVMEAFQGASSAKGSQRIARYIVSLGSSINDALVDRAVLEAIIRAEDVHPQAVGRFIARLRTEGVLATAGSDDIVKLIEDLTRWQKAGNLARGLHIGFAALDVVMLGWDIVSLVEMRNRLSETVANMEGSLTRAGFRKKGNLWVHEQTGASVELCQLQESVSSLSNPQSARVAADVAGLPLLAPCVSFGPAGLALAGVVILAHTGITVWEQNKSRDFLEHTPTAVIAALSTYKTVGEGEADIVANMSTWMISDFFNTSDFNASQKRLIRNKMMMIMLAHEIAAMKESSPEMVTELLGGKDISAFLDEHSELFTQDFEAIIKPYVAARLFQQSNDGSVLWKNFRELRVDNGVFDWQNVDESDMRLALREASFLYAKHVVQREYNRQKTSLIERSAARTQSGTPLFEHDYQIDQAVASDSEDQSEQDRLQALGSQTIFGRPISELPENRSAIADMLSGLTARFDETERSVDPSGAARSDMLAQNPDLFTVTLPEELQTQMTKPVIRLRSLANESLIEGQNEAPDLPVSEVLKKALSVFNELKNVGWVGLGAWQAQESHYRPLADYGSFLAQHRAHDPGNWMRTKIEKLAEWNWLTDNPGTDFSAKRNDAFHEVISALAIHISRLEAQVELTEITQDTPTEKAYYERDLALLRMNDVHTVYLSDPEGLHEPRVLSGVPGKTISFDAAPYGVLTCESEIGQTGSVSYRWKFKAMNASQAGAAFDIHAYESEPIHARHERAIKDLSLQRVVAENGEISYVRNGYTGMYELQSDGSVFYTGGEHDGKQIPPLTYVPLSGNMRQDFFERQQLSVQPGGMWMPIAERMEPVVRAKERVEIVKMSDLVLDVRRRTSGSKIYFPASGWMNMKITLLDGTVIEGRYGRDFASKVTPYFSIRRADVRNFIGYEFDGTSWRRGTEPSAEPVRCMIFESTAKGAADIASLELSDYGTSSQGYKYVYRYPEPQSPSSAPPQLAAE